MAKLDDALPRPHVSQVALGFVRVRAKCVSAPLKTTQLFHKKFLSPRELVRKCARSRIAFRSVCFAERRDHIRTSALSCNSSRIFRDFRFPERNRARLSSQRFDEFDFKNVAQGGACTFALLTLLEEKNFSRQMLPFHLRFFCAKSSALFFFLLMPTAALMSMVPEFVSTAARGDGSNCLTHSKGLRSYRVWTVFFFFFLYGTVCVEIDVILIRPTMY